MEQVEYRCVKCNRLLFKSEKFAGIVEVKCGKCGTVNKVKRVNDERK